MRRSLRSYSCFFSGCLALGIAASLPLFAQTAVPDANGNLVFKTNARTVVIDVVVTGKDGPARGLKKEDFQVLEDGKSQKITYLEEHTSHTQPTNLPPLPPNVYTNIPQVTPTDSVTVLLLDSMNTQLQDQTRIHAQMLKYLKNLQPGRRIAIFGLGNQLTFIQGFTDDSALLAAALNNPKNGSTPVASPLLKTQGEVAGENQPIALLADAAGGSAGNPNPQAASALAGLQQFQAEATVSQNDLRVKTTFQAFQELANYLAGIPGRKNVVWFSSAFPLTLFPDPSLGDSFAVQRDYSEEVKKTAALLTAAQVAIYPVAAEGLGTDSLYDLQQRSGAVVSGQSAVSSPALLGAASNPAQQRQQEQSASIQGDNVQRDGAHTAMDQIAKDTGGEAFYNTNDLNDAIARASDHGADYYTITYTPTNATEDGTFRKIQVKLAKKTSTNSSGGSFKLAYRRGYYADKAGTLEAAKPAGDPLHPYMGPGMPASTQIPFALRVLPGKTLNAASAPANEKNPAPATMQAVIHAGDNPELGKLLEPTTRYKVDFVVAARGLRLDEVPGGRHGMIEVTLVVYSADGKPLNWLVRQVNLDMSAARYALVQQNGVSVSFEIDVPQHGTILRAGVYDQLSNLAGTLEIPVNGGQNAALPNHAMR